MAKYLLTGHHGPVEPAEGRRIAAAGLVWIEEQLADGTLDCLYSMEGGGRLVIVNAGSADEALAIVRRGPDAPSREWSVVGLRDGRTVIRDYLAGP